MRSNIAYLVVLLVMLGTFAVLKTHPMALSDRPGNLLVGACLIAAGFSLALRKQWSYKVGYAACGITILAGFLSYRGILGIVLPGYPILWVVAGLYIAFRLSMNQHAAQKEEAKQKRRLGLDSPGEDE